MPLRRGLTMLGGAHPERIWHRLRWLGQAYELHLLPLLDGSTYPVFLKPDTGRAAGEGVQVPRPACRGPRRRDAMSAAMSATWNRSCPAL